MFFFLPTPGTREMYIRTELQQYFISTKQSYQGGAGNGVFRSYNYYSRVLGAQLESKREGGSVQAVFAMVRWPVAMFGGPMKPKLVKMTPKWEREVSSGVFEPADDCTGLR